MVHFSQSDESSEQNSFLTVEDDGLCYREADLRVHKILVHDISSSEYHT